nr:MULTISPECIES: hypothetical protein [Streptomyces]
MANATNLSPSPRPRPPGYPEPLRRTAAGHWGGTARATLGYTKANHAPWGRLTETAGALATAAAQAAQAADAVPAASGSPTRNGCWSGPGCGSSTG